MLQLIDQIAESKKIKKKFFLNYPFSVYQTRKEDATKDILAAVSLIKKNQPEIFLKKTKQIHSEFKVNLTVVYSSLFQVYIREHFASEFLIIEVPYLVPGVDQFQGLYWPQQNILDDLIIFMRDGLVDNAETPTNVSVPILPVDVCCKLLLSNIENTSATINNFYCCSLRWQMFFYIISDHFTIHSASHAYAGPEVKAIEGEKKTKVTFDYQINLVANRIPQLISRKTKNYSLQSFLKELRVTMKMSGLVENSMAMLSEESWKIAVDNYIYGVRRYLLNDKTNRIEVYSKYGILRDNYMFRKQSFFHWGLIKGKVQNVNDFDSSYFAERVVNCRRLQDAIQEDISHFINSNPNVTEEDIQNRKIQIDADIKLNLDLLSTHFKRFGMLTLAMGSHYMFRRMFDGVIFK